MEEWRPIPGFEGFYEASTMGQVRSVARAVTCGPPGWMRHIKGKVLNPSQDPDGYELVSLSTGSKQKSYRLHRLILLTFKGPCPPGMESRHLNGTPNDNKLSNLDWGTPVENWQDREAHGRGISGERNPHAILRKRNVSSNENLWS